MVSPITLRIQRSQAWGPLSLLSLGPSPPFPVFMVLTGCPGQTWAVTLPGPRENPRTVTLPGPKELPRKLTGSEA